MKVQKYIELYQQLNINVEPLPTNYNPETFGRELMQGCYVGQNVSYSAATNLNDDNEELYCCE